MTADLQHMACDPQRLQRLLGGSELADLRRRLRVRFEHGKADDAFTLTRLSMPERRALEGLLGRPVKASSSMRLSLSELDAALSRAGIASDLRAALELLDGPIHNLKAERLAREQAWNEVLRRVDERHLRTLLADPQGVALLKRLSGSDVETAATLLERARLVLARLPARGLPLARLAAETLGDAHALDVGSPVASLVLRAWSAESASALRNGTSSGGNVTPDQQLSSGQDSTGTPTRVRDQWALVGVSVNELAAPVLCLNLPACGDSRGARLMQAAAESGEPLHLTLRVLLREPPAWDVAARAVFICENPSVVEAAADRLGPACAPLVCTDGMPAAAQRTVLHQLDAAGARLCYHGDFDWPGLRIGNFVIRTFGALPWRFGVKDYLAAAARIDSGKSLARDDSVAAAWDSQLADAMAQRGVAIHEETVIDALLADLRSSGLTPV